MSNSSACAELASSSAANRASSTGGSIVENDWDMIVKCELMESRRCTAALAFPLEGFENICFPCGFGLDRFQGALFDFRAKGQNGRNKKHRKETRKQRVDLNGEAAGFVTTSLECAYTKRMRCQHHISFVSDDES